MLYLSFTLLLALLLDKLFAEPKRFHPLVGFGRYAKWVEDFFAPEHSRRWQGVIALVFVILPFLLLACWLEYAFHSQPFIYSVIAGLIVYLAIAWQSLLQHAQAIARPLQQGDLIQAREEVAKIVSRDCSQLDEIGIAKAATESVLENGADAIFHALFWFAIAGIPGVVLYRLANTLDAMWGYKNQRYLSFGWAAARLDDVLNYLPARITALLYALAGHTGKALDCWFKQAKYWKSPSAGPVMTAGAGAMNTRLGGSAAYFGTVEQRMEIGCGEEAKAASIEQALQLVNRSLLLWCVVCLLISVAGRLW